MRFVAAAFFALALSRFCGAPAGAQADTSTSPATGPAQGCVAPPGAIGASAAGVPLSAGLGLVAHDGKSTTLTLVVPWALTSIQSTLPVDKATFVNSAGSAHVTWKLHDPSLPYRFLNLIATDGGVHAVTAINLRGLQLCVRNVGGADVADLDFPNGLGTVRFTVPQQGPIAVAAASDQAGLALQGTVSKDHLSGPLTLSRMQNGAWVPLGTASFTPTGLDGASAAASAIDISLGAAKLAITDLRLHVTPDASTSKVTATFTPTLPPSLPFVLQPAVVEVAAEKTGEFTLRCDNNLTVTATKALLGTAPALTLALGGPSADPIAIACDTGHYVGLAGTLAVTWPRLTADAPATTTTFGFNLPFAGTPRFIAPADGLPNVQFDAFGLQVDATHPVLGGTSTDLALTADVQLTLRAFAKLATAPAKLTLAIRPPGADGQPRLALTCTSAAPPAPAKGTLVLLADCSADHEIDGVTTAGGPLKLPAIAGESTITIPAFKLAKGAFMLNGPATCPSLDPSSGSPGRFMSFGPITLKTCSVEYDAPTASLQAKVDGTVALPQFLIAKGSIVNVSSTIGYQPKTKRYGLRKLDASLVLPKDQAIDVLGMSITNFRDTAKASTACRDGYIMRAASDDEAVLNAPLELTLCAQASLPEYLSFESQRRIGLLKDGVLEPKATRPPFFFFNGLRFNAQGLVPPTDTELSSNDDCTSPTGFGNGAADTYYDCRAWGSYDQAPATLGPLSVSNIRVNVVARALDVNDRLQPVPADTPQFHFRADVAFAKYLSGDEGGTITADFDHKHMVMLGTFKKPLTVHAGVISLGLQSFEMDLSSSQRKFVASGASVGNDAGVNSLSLYFKEISFIETRDDTRAGSPWRLKQLKAPVDVPKTALGLAYRLFSDLSGASFLRLFGLGK